MTVKVDQRLLGAQRDTLTPTSAFHAVNNAHGLYDGLRFVVRLSPVVHELIAGLPGGITTSGEVSWEQVQAFSTYLHETIHWWQHAGSTCGLMMSLSYPAQTHANINHARQFLAAAGPVKSVLDYAKASSEPVRADTAAGLANIIINNQFDIQAYRLLVTNPERAEALVNSGRFESVGHVYHIALSQGLNAIASTFDRELAFVPDFLNWEQPYAKLRAARVPGYFYGCPVELPPLGAFHIFEGQARFGQLQYLHFASGGRFDFDDAREAGMLGDDYTAAFDLFLALTELERPSAIGHPNVALFLLVCDIAINAGEGFPLAVPNFRTLVDDVDPGIRFLRLCVALRDLDDRSVTDYGFAEFERLSDALCKAAGLIGPLAIAREVARWTEQSSGFRQCLERHDHGRSSELNAPIDIMIGQFLSFARDKCNHAHILCWPGAHMAGDRLTPDSVGLFSRQSPLFIDRAGDTMIVPVLRPGLAEADIMETFQRFYDGHALYDLTEQWITASGPFTYRFAWLQPNGTDAEIKAWADRIFAGAYGVEPDAFTLLASGGMA